MFQDALQIDLLTSVYAPAIRSCLYNSRSTVPVVRGRDKITRSERATATVDSRCITEGVGSLVRSQLCVSDREQTYRADTIDRSVVPSSTPHSREFRLSLSLSLCTAYGGSGDIGIWSFVPS